VATLQSIRRCDDGGIDPNLERIETFAVEVASISKVYYIFGIGMKWIKKTCVKKHVHICMYI
jgi:plastocyanin domain-containing protein